MPSRPNDMYHDRRGYIRCSSFCFLLRFWSSRRSVCKRASGRALPDNMRLGRTHRRRLIRYATHKVITASPATITTIANAPMLSMLRQDIRYAIIRATIAGAATPITTIANLLPLRKAIGVSFSRDARKHRIWSRLLPPIARNTSRVPDAAIDAKIRYIWRLVTCAKGRLSREPVKAENKSRGARASNSRRRLEG